MDLNTCICGRTHAPWWGRFVPAPTCVITLDELRRDLFIRVLRELEGEK